MSKKGFQQTNKERIEKGEEPFANPRNAAAGTVRQLDSKKVADKPLDIFFYDILKMEGNGFSSHWEALKQFSRWGLATDPHSKKHSDFEGIKEYRDRLAEERDDLDYDIDGIVIKLDDYELRRKLGTRQRSPRWALAWKFPPKKEVTILEEIVVQVGRTGMLTPVALLQPVDVGGVTVSRATLHNEEEVLRKDVRPGDKVRVARAGDVIPEVMERIKEPGKKRGNKFSMPDTCPACSAKVIKEGAYYFCPAGLSCPSQLIGHIIHFASRDALDIEGLGDKTAKDMVDKEMVKDMADLYQLSVDDLLQLDGFAQKSATQLYEAIQSTKNPRLDRFLYALGIRHVGQHIARVLSQEYRTFDKLRKTSRSQLEEIAEIGPGIAQSVEKFFGEEENRAVLDRLASLGIKPQEMESGKETTALEGKTFVFTGKLQGYTRKEAEDRVETLGARATSSVSSQTDYVVVGENPGSKIDEAREQGVEILDEKEFEELLKKHSIG
jgi:DNA ligase (NAD+)